MTKKVSKNKVDEAGRSLRKGIGDLEAARDVARLWRTFHFFPLQAVFKRLQNIAKLIQPEAIIAGRQKRMESIEAKLKRGTTRLSDMQDIAGCRMVLRSILHVRKTGQQIEPFFGKHSRKDDYIQYPKLDGYRGVHYIHAFKDCYLKCDGAITEVQLRTELQHIWATAVETVDGFTGQNLKGGVGDPEWARFFAIVSSVFALREDSPVVPGTPSAMPDLVRELLGFHEKIQLCDAYSAAQHFVSTGIGRGNQIAGPYFLLTVDLEPTLVAHFKSFTLTDIETGNLELANIEREIAKGRKTNAVLVSVDTVASLREAYPNYFADMRKFIAELKTITV